MRLSINVSRLFLLFFLSSATAALGQAPQFQDAAFTVRLTAPLSTKTSQVGQEITAEVIAPVRFQHWFMIGKVNQSLSSGSFKKKSQLRFSFQRLANATGSDQYLVNANVTSFANSKGVQNTDEEGQIVESKNDAGKATALGALVGAGIGAALGGAKGAGIGAAAGVGAGLLFASFGVKGPTISFETGSQFELSVTTHSADPQ